MRIFSWNNYHCYYVHITGNNTDLMQSLLKLQMALSIEINNLQLVWNHKTLQIEKAILRKKDVGGIMLPDFKLYHKATAIKRVLYHHEIKSVDQCNKIESSEINSCMHAH